MRGAKVAKCIESIDPGGKAKTKKAKREHRSEYRNKIGENCGNKKEKGKLLRCVLAWTIARSVHTKHVLIEMSS